MRLHIIVAGCLFAFSAVADYLNPCGIIQGENAWFGMSIQPESVPDSEIMWLQSGEGSVEFPDGNTGRVVRVQGASCGDVKLEIQIGDARSRRPCFHAKVITNAVVGVSIWVISDGITPATTPERAMAMLERAAVVWRQAGISFRLDEYCVTNRPDMLEAAISSTNGMPTVYDVAELNPVAGGCKVYCLNQIKDGNGNDSYIKGVTVRGGIIVATNATLTTLAHEMGHSFGLKDIYTAYPMVPQTAAGPVQESMTPDDWNGGTGQRYYRPGTGIEDLIPRLMMYAMGVDSRADITIGDVYGLWYSNRWNSASRKFERVWQTSLAPVGFFRHGMGGPQHGHDETQEGNGMTTMTNLVATVSAGIAATCAMPMRQSATDGEEKALQTIVRFAGFDHAEDIAATYKAAFDEVGGDKERMTSVLIRSVHDAVARKYESWQNVVPRSIGYLAEYGSTNAIPFVESVITNDVYGAGENAANAYVRLAGGDGRDIAFFMKNFGAGKMTPRGIGRVIYRTVGERLKDKALSEDKRREYTEYLLARAECERDIVTGDMLDKMLVETVPWYRDSEKRKDNIRVIAKPDPLQPHVIYRGN